MCSSGSLEAWAVNRVVVIREHNKTLGASLNYHYFDETPNAEMMCWCIREGCEHPRVTTKYFKKESGKPCTGSDVLLPPGTSFTFSRKTGKCKMVIAD